MHIKSIYVDGFRNLSQLNESFEKGVTFIVGENGVGKTNFLESVYLLFTSKSFRTHRYQEMLAQKKHAADMDARLSTELVLDDESSHCLSLSLSKNKKSWSINHDVVRQVAYYLRKFPVVLTSLEDYWLIKGAPEYRRQFVDRGIYYLEPDYLEHYLQYSQIVKQKKALLGQGVYKNSDRTLLDVWNEQLLSFATEIDAARYRYCEKLSPLLYEFFSKIVQTKQKISLNYRPSLLSEDQRTGKIAEIHNQEIERRQCLYGPHRDEFEFLIDGLPFRNYGSQGQIRSLIFSLKLAQLKLLKQELDIQPLLLVDDFYADLDYKKIANLLTLFQTVTEQVLITAPAQKDFYKQFHLLDLNFVVKTMDNGKIYAFDEA